MKEWNENKLDQELDALLSEIPEPEQDEFEKRVEKYINRRIRKIVHKTLAGILVIVILLLGIINPFLNLICLNPAKTNDDDVISIYHDVMRDYYDSPIPVAELNKCFQSISNEPSMFSNVPQIPEYELSILPSVKFPVYCPSSS